MEKTETPTKVYCMVCGEELEQVYFDDKKIRVYPCTNPECNSNKRVVNPML